MTRTGLLPRSWTRGARRGVALLAVSVLAVAASPSIAQGAGEVAGFAASPSGGWYIAFSDGVVEVGGGARHHGDMEGAPLNLPVTGASATPSGNGYWLVASDGGIFSFGDAAFYGSTGAISLNRPIVGMAPTPSGNGYWLVASDGGIFSFGDAAFYGSTGAISLNRPIVGMSATASGNGYWLVASDGGIFSFGDARFHGSTGGEDLPAPIVGMTASPSGNGYWLVGAQGHVYAFGDATYLGEPVGRTYGPVVGIAPRVAFGGYAVVDTGGHHTYGSDTDREGEHYPSTSAILATTDRIAADILARANDERSARGIAALRSSVELAADAHDLAQRMADAGGIAHNVDFSALFARYGATAGGENVAYTSAADTPAQAHVMWMKSTGHRVNILNSGFDTIGVGVACKGGTAYLSVLFLRTGGYGPLDTFHPQNPITRADSDPYSRLHCG